MPVIKSAKKKLRQDKKRAQANTLVEVSMRKLIKKAHKTPSEKNIREAAKIADKAAKKNIIHKNKAARIKSSLSKLLPRKTKPEVKTTKKIPAKQAKTPKK